MIARRKAQISCADWLLALGSLFRKGSDPASAIAAWEQAFAGFIGTKYAVATASGRQGLECILRSLKLNPGDEVLLPAYTLKDLVWLIKKLGLIPVAVDIEPDSFNLSVIGLKNKISAKTRVIIATHIFGLPCKIDEILALAQKHSLFVIEDCAHSAGAAYQGKKTGSFGIASFFSFESMKPVNTYGGGMVLTDDAVIAGKIREAAAGYKKTNALPLGKMIAALTESILFSTLAAWPILYLLSSRSWNAKITQLYRLVQRPPKTNTALSGFQARIGLVKLQDLGERIGKRQAAADFLKTLLDGRIKPQAVSLEASPNYYFFVVLLPQNAWQVRRSLLSRGVDAGVAGEVTDNCGEVLGADCPVANEVFNRAIQLPLYEGLSERKIRRIARFLNESLA